MNAVPAVPVVPPVPAPPRVRRVPKDFLTNDIYREVSTASLTDMIDAGACNELKVKHNDLTNKWVILHRNFLDANHGVWRGVTNSYQGTRNKVADFKKKILEIWSTSKTMTTVPDNIPPQDEAVISSFAAMHDTYLLLQTTTRQAVEERRQDDTTLAERLLHQEDIFHMGTEAQRLIRRGPAHAINSTNLVRGQHPATAVAVAASMAMANDEVEIVVGPTIVDRRGNAAQYNEQRRQRATIAPPAGGANAMFQNMARGEGKDFMAFMNKMVAVPMGRTTPITPAPPLLRQRSSNSLVGMPIDTKRKLKRYRQDIDLGISANMVEHTRKFMKKRNKLLKEYDPILYASDSSDSS